MKTLMHFFIFAVTILPSKAYQQMAAKPSSLQKLFNLEGSWVAQATLEAEGKKLHFPYYMDYKKTANGSGLTMTERAAIPGIAKLEGTNLIGFDPNDEKIHWYSVDNLGTTHEHIGDFTSDNHFYMEHNGTRDGKNYVEKIDMEWRDKNTVWIKLVGLLDGAVVEKLEGTFKRKM